MSNCDSLMAFCPESIPLAAKSISNDGNSILLVVQAKDLRVSSFIIDTLNPINQKIKIYY